MSKQIVNENEFITICNQELKNHPNYKEGMEIIGNPQGCFGSDLNGYTCIGLENMPGIVSQVVNAVKEKYELRITPR